MKNIVLAGLAYEDNLGDVLLGQCIEYQILKYFIEKEIDKDVEIRILDLQGRVSQHGSLKRTLFDRIKQKCVGIRLFKQYEKKITMSYIRDSIDRHTIGVVIWGAIFDCDGSRQFFSPACQCIRRCHSYGIPVMLACLPSVHRISQAGKAEIKQLVNDSCVEVIAMRDDDSIISEGIIGEGSLTKLYDACDAAWCTSERYPFDIKKENRIGLCIGHYGLLFKYQSMGEKEQLEWWHKVIEELLKEGQEVSIFTNGYQPDYEMAKKVFEHCSDINVNSKIILKNKPHSVEEYISEVVKCNRVITQRMHAGIIAYSYNIPMKMLQWNKKQEDFCKKIGRRDLCIEVSEENINDLVKDIIGEFDNYLNIQSCNYYINLQRAFGEFISNLDL